MTTAEARTEHSLRACTLDELAQDGMKVVTLGGHTILLVFQDGEVSALDNRCPHMGFPLHRGTVRDGILTCHWHHARFDLAGGCTLDPFADDVPFFPLAIEDGIVYVDPRPIVRDRRAHWMHKLTEGLEQNIPLVQAKSVIGLSELDETNDVLLSAALFGLNNRADDWSTGLSILTAMANVLPALRSSPGCPVPGRGRVRARTGRCLGAPHVRALRLPTLDPHVYPE